MRETWGEVEMLEKNKTREKIQKKKNAKQMKQKHTHT